MYPINAVHIPPPQKDRVPKVRRKMMFFDRIKVLLIIALIIAFGAAKQAADIPNTFQLQKWFQPLDLLETR